MDRKHAGVVPRGKGIQIDFQYRGVRCRELLRLQPTAKNLAYAHQKPQAIKFQIETNRFDYLAMFPRSKLGKRLFRSGATTTVTDLLLKFLQDCQTRTEFSTYRDYRSAVYHHLIPAFGEKPAADLRASHIREWANSQAISGKRINNVLVPLRGALRHAVVDDIVGTNVLDAVPSRSHRVSEPDPFSLEEQLALLSVCEPMVRNLFQFAFWSGLRTSELIALQWADVNFRAGVVHVHRASVRKRIKQPKTSSGIRDVRLLSAAREALESQRRLVATADGPVFLNPRTGGAWETDTQIRRTAWEPAIARSGVRRRYPYQTRHTFASTMLSSGENAMWVATQMGHKDWGMIRRVYGRWMPSVDPTAGLKGDLAWTQTRHGVQPSA